MFSMPTTSATSISPRMIDPAASVSALALDPQALFTVYAGTVSGTPARTDTWRPGLGPLPACRPCPATVSSTWPGSIPAASSAARAAAIPRSTAGTSANAPMNRPIGVRLAPTTTTERCSMTPPRPGQNFPAIVGGSRSGPRGLGAGLAFLGGRLGGAGLGAAVAGRLEALGGILVARPAFAVGRPCRGLGGGRGRLGGGGRIVGRGRLGGLGGGGGQDRLGGLGVPVRRLGVAVRRPVGAVVDRLGQGRLLRLVGRLGRGEVGVARAGGRQHPVATVGGLLGPEVGEPGALLGRAGGRLDPEPGRRGRGRLVQVLLLLLDPADAGADLVQHRLQVAVDPAQLLQRAVPQGLQPDRLALDPDALALGLLPDHVGRVAGLLQHRARVLLGLGPHLLGHLEGVLLDPRALVPGLLEELSGVALDLAGPVLGRLDDLGGLLLGGLDRLLGPVGRVGQHVLGGPAGLLEDAGHVRAEVAEGRGALVLDLHPVGTLLGLVGPKPLLLDLAGHLGGPDLHLAAVEAPKDDHEVRHVDLRLTRHLWLERAHGGDLPLCGLGTGYENTISPDDPPVRAIAYRPCHGQPKPAIFGQLSRPSISSPSTSGPPWSSRSRSSRRPAVRPTKSASTWAPSANGSQAPRSPPTAPRNSSARPSSAWSISPPGESPASSPKS